MACGLIHKPARRPLEKNPANADRIKSGECRSCEAAVRTADIDLLQCTITSQSEILEVIAYEYASLKEYSMTEDRQLDCAEERGGGWRRRSRNQNETESSEHVDAETLSFKLGFCNFWTPY